MPEDLPPISVVVAVWNGARFIEDALHSLLAGTIVPAELIVVDDGSTDDSAERAERIPGVRVQRRPHEGVAAARNAGVTLCTTELVAFHDADDRRAPGGLEAQVRYLAERPEVGCVIGAQAPFLEPGTAAPPWWVEGDAAAGMPAVGQMAVRRAAFERVGGFADGVYLEDVDWMVRARAVGVRVDLIDDVVVHRRAHDDNRSQDEGRARSDLMEILQRRMAAKRAGA